MTPLPLFHSDHLKIVPKKSLIDQKEDTFILSVRFYDETAKRDYLNHPIIFDIFLFEKNT
jgi:hypothetical protein